MELKDTIELMCSEDYKERFKAEYLQTKIRCNKLEKMLLSKKRGELPFETKCSTYLLSSQLKTMNRYLSLLEIRAAIEDIEL